MKKVIGFILFAVILGACGKLPEEKANLLIKEDITKILVKADTYEPVETELDSAFAPYDKPEFIESALKYVRLFMAMEECDEKMKNAKSEMSIYESPFMTSFSKNEYADCKAEYEEWVKKKKEIEKRLTRSGSELKKLANVKYEFIGFKTIHSYRANNNAGNTLFGEQFYIFDKELKTILASFNEEEYKIFQGFLEELKESSQEE